jgi:hypothetical protein
VLAPTVRHPETLAAEAASADLLVGDAPAGVIRMLEERSRGPMIRPPEGAPHARWLIALTGRSGGASRVEAVTTWEPEYGRPAEAQARWEMTHGRPLPDSIGGSR